MQKYQDTIVDQSGNGVSYGIATVTNYPSGTAATIYSDDGVTLISGNAVRADAIGRFDFYAANGAYTITFTGTNIVTYSKTNVILFDPADDGAASIEFLQSGTGSVSRTLQDKNREIKNVTDKGADPTGVASSQTAFQNVATDAATFVMTDGTYKLTGAITIASPFGFSGNGAKTLVRADTSFPATTIFNLAPPASTDPKLWDVGNFRMQNSGAATNAFTLDIGAVNKYISKFTLHDVACDQVSDTFVKLINSVPNADGFFTSSIRDNWSLGGYNMENCGDSLYFERNTVSGAGLAFYVKQMATASNVTIRACNLTSLGGALFCDKGANISFIDNQVECPGVYTGSRTALVDFDGGGVTLIANTRVRDCNINTQTSNPTLACIRMDYVDGAEISGNTLYCDPATGTHINIGSGARNVWVGPNKYYRTDTGAELSPVIVDNGIGTMGVWKAATLTLAGWANISPGTFHPTGYFKSIDGIVSLRGQASGPVTVVGDTLFTLPVGFRPANALNYYASTQGLIGGVLSNVLLQILSTGSVQCLTANATAIYFSGITISTK